MTRCSRHPLPSPSPAPVARVREWPADWMVYAVIFLLAMLVYLPALSGGLIWDDAGHVTRPDLRSFEGLGRIWFEFGATQQYYPVLHSAFWIEHRIWGDATLGYHLLNVLLHASAACMFGTILRRLAVPGAWFAALLFALHPVCVESVAWISEQKNTLSLVLYLASALAYLRFDTGRERSHYALASVLFLLALLTKTVTATLPAALLVVFWWKRGRLEWRRDVLPLIPWFAIGAISGLVTAHFERVLIGAQGADFDLNILERCLLAGRVFWFYIGKLVWPSPLVFIYPRWTVDASVAWQWLFPLAGLALLAGLLLWRRRSRGPLAAALLFAGSLFPVLGFFNVFPFLFSYVADHFQYLASLAVFALGAAGLRSASVRLPVWIRYSAGTALLGTLGALSWSQAATYRDVVTLYQTTIERNPACWMAHNNLATVFADAGRIQEAIPHLEAALRLKPDYALAENNLGDDLMHLNRVAEAIPHLERAIQLQPTFATAHNNLGSALVLSDRVAEAIACFETALRYQPLFPLAERNLGMALAMSGRNDEAIKHFARAIELEPGYADAELGWAMALKLTGRFPEAERHFQRALRLEPNSASLHYNYGCALEEAGRVDDAIQEFTTAIRIDPNNAESHYELAKIYRSLGRRDEALRHITRAAELNPALLKSP